jgi:hypothetical protein
MVDRENAADVQIGTGGEFRRWGAGVFGRGRGAAAYEQKKHRQRQERAGGA